MMKRPVLYLSAILLLATGAAKAQTFGGNPPSVKWRQITTPEARIIFPAGLDSTGKRVAAIIQQINKPVMPTIGRRQKLINVVVQNQTLTTNGYVGLAPFRSEFYVSPMQNSFALGSLPIAEQLAVHEYRHVQQVNNFDVGLTRLLHIIFGEGGQAVAYSLAIPNWFSEGDAVFNETLTTGQGRGRLPWFFNGYRSLWAAGKDYSWMKLRDGSYRDYVPDWYPMGYMLVSYGRDKFGAEVWRGVTHDAAAYKSLFYPFQQSFKKHTGQQFGAFQKEAFGYFKQQTVSSAQVKKQRNYPATQHYIASREFPAYIDDSTLIYRKTSYQHRPVFVLRKNGVEQNIRLSDIVNDSYFDYHDGQIVYAANRPDIRWGYRDYNELKVIDIKSGLQRRLTTKTKYFSPAFSADGKQLVVVNVPPSGKYELLILDAATGRVVESVPNPDHVFYTYPKFYADNQLIAAVRQPSGKMAIALVDRQTGRNEYLTTPNIAPKAFPVVYRDTVYFTATTGKEDQLYALAVKSRKLFQLQHDSLKSSIGAYQPAVSNNRLAWMSVSAFGNEVHNVEKATVQLNPVAEGPLLQNFNIASLQNDTAAGISTQVEPKEYIVKKYPKFTHPFNFHSLIPYFDDPDYTFALTGENILNTLQSELAFNYNRNEGYKQLSFTSTYGALFPYLFGEVSCTMDRRKYFLGSNNSILEANWNETNIQAGLQLPLNLSRGRHFTSINLRSSVSYTVTDVAPLFNAVIPDNTYLTNSVTFSNQIAKPVQNIYPHLAQIITVNFRNTINSLQANQFLASGTFYFPSLSVNHNFVVNAAYQQRDRNYSFFSNQLSFSRGYTADNLYRLSKVGVSYHFPIAYPDAGVANLIYLLRLRGAVFYDYTHGRDFYTNGTVFKADFRSVGGELYFDTKWFNENPITFGLRYTHLLDRDIFGGNGQNRVTLILPLSIF
ncbi:hypothetical protein KHS38_03160 [Mucilaginibacter sp. Bleaf8]|uniref:hypothetical protein n=1 Tax=Mucilaginibacter sp. Bleaf8 TaxID=2834430 RepID=UPI001BCC17E9|nr:hypothetical protein [Mucilaginibacter sp. Bleaf8]MBS7563392.1 hypothetical protein [Mucilaginibacter sp. Bleaf8]